MKPNPNIDTTHPVFVRRFAGEINRTCAANGFYSGFGCADGQRKFAGHVTVRRCRLIVHEVGSGGVDLTGGETVNGNGGGLVGASRRARRPR